VLEHERWGTFRDSWNGRDQDILVFVGDAVEGSDWLAGMAHRRDVGPHPSVAEKIKKGKLDEKFLKKLKAAKEWVPYLHLVNAEIASDVLEMVIRSGVKLYIRELSCKNESAIAFDKNEGHEIRGGMSSLYVAVDLETPLPMWHPETLSKYGFEVEYGPARFTSRGVKGEAKRKATHDDIIEEGIANGDALARIIIPQVRVGTLLRKGNEEFVVDQVYPNELVLVRYVDFPAWEDYVGVDEADISDYALVA
jgi:predicted peroxiredoxin